MHPVDSIIHSAVSTANRVGMRDYLETTKNRFLQQYKDYLPKDAYGNAKFPATRNEIVEAGNLTGKDIADARTAWEFINSLEKGYVNNLDETIKSAVKFSANILGNLSVKAPKSVGKGLSLAEKAAMEAGEVGVTAFSANTASHLFLSLNPLRQLPLQWHQAMGLVAINPKYAVKGLTKDLSAMVASKVVGVEKAAKLAGRSVDDMKEIIRQFEKSGLAAAIDKNTLVNGALADMAKNKSFKRSLLHPKSAIPTMLEMGRKVGFDAGEWMSTASSWLVHRDMALKGGKLTEGALMDVSGKARNFNLNMNKVGTMPYDANSAKLLFQYMQVPHKAALQVTTNRILTPAEKARLIGFQAMMWTLPTSLMYNLLGSTTTGNDAVDDIIVQGAEGALFNAALSAAYGEDVRLDWGALSPQNMYGTYQFVEHLLTGNLPELVAASPAGSLVFGSNPRITNAFKGIASLVHPSDPSTVPYNWKEVAKSTLNMASGYSNVFKMSYAMEKGRQVNSLGDVVDSDVNNMEALFRLAGIPTMDETQYYYLKQEQYLQSKEFTKDVKAWYKDMKRRIAGSDLKDDEARFTAYILGDAWLVFGANKLKAQQIIQQELERDRKNGDASLVKGALETFNYGDPEKTKAFINRLPNTSQEKKKELRDAIDSLQNLTEE